MPSFASGVTHTLFAVQEYLAPKASGRLAFWLFSRTPNPRRPSTREREALGRHAPFMEEARLHRLRIKSGWIAAHVFKPGEDSSLVGPTGEVIANKREMPTALVIHGWRSRSEHMVPVIMKMRAAGFRVVALDLPGHGKSQGRSLTMASAVEACAEAEKWFGPFKTIIGHSFGGAVAMSATAGSVRRFAPLDTERLVLISAPNSMPAYFRWFASQLGLGKRTRAELENRVESLTGAKLAEFIGVTQLSLTRIPTLVVHAQDDQEVSAENARALAGAGTHVALQWIPDAGHRRILRDDMAHEAISEFVNRRGAPWVAPLGLHKRPVEQA